MKKVRNLTKKLPILVLFLIFGCQNDSLIEAVPNEILQTKSFYSSSTIFKEDIQANEKLITKMTSLATLKYHQIDKNVYNETYGFTINTDVAKLVESANDNSHSYTFSIDSDTHTDSFVENLVFSYDALNDDYNAGLITYHLSAEQKQEYLANGHVTTPYNISFSSIDVSIDDVLNKSELPCTVTYQEFHQPQGSSNTYLYSSNGTVLNNCEHENDDDPCDTYTEIIIYCPDGGGAAGTTHDTGTSEPTNTNTNDYSNTGGSGSASDDTATNDEPEETNVVTSLLTREESTKEAILNCINGLASFNSTDLTTINPELLNQTDLTISNWLNFNNYLQTNNCSEEAQQEVIEDIINAYDDYKIINELEGKALCVYNKLKSSSSGFKSAIKKFDGDFPVAHLKFVEEDLGATRGTTKPPFNGYSPDYVITVVLNNNINTQGTNYRPNLLVAKTIVHEVIHAEMFRKLMSVVEQGNFDSITRPELITLLENSDYPGIYDYYRRYNNWQHAQMATHYREAIARVLQEFDTGTAVPDSQQPQQLYMDLAWEGLKYDSIPTWANLPQTEKTRINNVIANYINNNFFETCTE